MKKIKSIHTHNGEHWVGDGFPVKNIFSYSNQALMQDLSPFLLLDHAGPATFTPTEKRRGVGQHPHRGFETVTIVYEGELEHQDSAGNGGKIGAGDVQWMTAAAGILHEEYHSQRFAKEGGILHMAQLWVNLPAKDKLAEPRYQTVLNASIPSIKLANDSGALRIIAGEYQGEKGPSKTFTPMNVWDIQLNAGKTLDLELPEGQTAALVVLQGTVKINDTDSVSENKFVIFEREAGTIKLAADADSIILFLGGAPLNEPVVAYGPFVMNTQGEIKQAVSDYQQGLFG
ncbi:pirin family protein [Methylotenera versatilis]|uniref:pirin family protein n=1 Tax=Methylotenera versatilis TaxID=1055487 RepID=UPI0006472D2E|nr:pirin family protein [Methylotenera versatilis]